jgi:hypothetical protein
MSRFITYFFNKKYFIISIGYINQLKCFHTGGRNDDQGHIFYGEGLPNRLQTIAKKDTGPPFSGIMSKTPKDMVLSDLMLRAA